MSTAVGAAEVDEAVQARPRAELLPFVAAYHGYRQRGVPPALHRGLPSPFLTVIFTLDEPLHIAQHADPGQAPGSYRTLVGGLHTAPALITHDGAQSGIQLQMSPLGARALFGLPAGELTSVDVAASELLGPVADEVHEQLRCTGTWAARFAVLDSMLARRVADRPGPPPEVGHAWRLLLRSGGGVSVAELARETGWSARHLTNRMRAEAGLSPKAAARVIRFDRARRILQARAGRTTFADVAADCGYYDQSHLVREFNALAGCPPSRWLAAEFGNVQATAVRPREAGRHD
jgi:AraC-like DNA-binding protein